MINVKITDMTVYNSTGTLTTEQEDILRNMLRTFEQSTLTISVELA